MKERAMKEGNIKARIKAAVVRSDILSAFRRRAVAGMGEISFRIMKRSYGQTAYGDRIRAFRGRYEGKRCFIIGNGPSLRPEDLDLLKQEYTFGANRIYLMYGRTLWRPTFYVCQDKDMLKAEQMNITGGKAGVDPCSCFIGYNSMKKTGTRFPDSNPYLMDNRAALWRKEGLPFSFDCERQVADGTTVTYSSIQLAVYMGFTRIYLLGMDHHFPHTIDKNRRITYDAAVRSHFDPRYKDIYETVEQKRTIVLAVYDQEMAEAAYKSALAAAGSRGVGIFNATRGGELEVFPRVRLEQVI